MIPMPPDRRFGVRRWNTVPVLVSVAIVILLVVLLGLFWTAAAR